MFKIPLVNSLWMASRMSLKLFTPSSCFHATASTQLKEIRTNKVGNTLIIEGINVPSPRENYLIPNDGKSCPLARLNLNVKHTDVLILSQFVRPDGCMLPQRITGLSKIKQKKITKLVSMAHKAGNSGFYIKN
ncbi:Hypothetical protein CINCED_3A010214 [Cinara cedri]|uniref:Ribosomal protein S18 n=1 Tax=Cinara cedri TaxID=506608 RepID=A0A5E4MJ30_9HEMI|nr:Hypothetical protein CINCED_3A010214 [Cinara cedri]